MCRVRTNNKILKKGEIKMNPVNKILGKECPRCEKGRLSYYNYGNDTTECNNPLCNYIIRGDVR